MPGKRTSMTTIHRNRYALRNSSGYNTGQTGPSNEPAYRFCNSVRVEAYSTRRKRHIDSMTSFTAAPDDREGPPRAAAAARSRDETQTHRAQEIPAGDSTAPLETV